MPLTTILTSNPQEDEHQAITDQNIHCSHDDENDDNVTGQLLPLLQSSPTHSIRSIHAASTTQTASVATPSLNLYRIISYLCTFLWQPLTRWTRECCCFVSATSSNTSMKRTTTVCTMHCVAAAVLWGTITALFFAIVWYSYELFNHGTEPHYIAWFSAGAFVLLGFPISMYGIISHLTNYNAPHIQVYIVRILWMVPIYSIESWLAMRFHKQAVFIETARDVYESFVLYCFLQFLIQVLGGEQALILLLKDKSPTRGVHMCYGLDKILGFKPWLMGQPIRRSMYVQAASNTHDYVSTIYSNGTTESNSLKDDEVEDPHSDQDDPSSPLPHRVSVVERVTAALSPAPRPHNRFIRVVQHQEQASPNNTSILAAPISGGVTTSSSTYYRVYWTSPFFIQCKFGVLQYVLIKFFCAIAVLILEPYGWYKEGQFHLKAGYLYICILTNVSQCYALYCLVFFYFATKNELSPIRPVGKFLSVKALVFFTWWQSVLISVMYQLEMIPNYKASTTEKNWNPEDVAKGIQDYCICIEMFVAAIVHSFVFPHSEYSIAAVRGREQAMGVDQGQNDRYARNSALDESGRMIYYNTKKRLGRRTVRQHPPRLKLRTEVFTSQIQGNPSKSATVPTCASDIELMQLTIEKNDQSSQSDCTSYVTSGNVNDVLRINYYPMRPPLVLSTDDYKDEYFANNEASNKTTPTHIVDPNLLRDSKDDRSRNRPGLFRAFIDTAIPRDLHDNTVNLFLQRGEYTSNHKTTLLHHAATSDQYDLFAKNNHMRHQQQYNKQRPSVTGADRVHNESPMSSLDNSSQVKGNGTVV